MRTFACLFFLILLLLKISCAYSEDVNSLLAKADELYSTRHQPGILEQIIAILEKCHLLEPENQFVLAYLSKCYYMLAYNFKEDEKEQMELYFKGKEYGFKGLLINKNFKEGLEKENLKKAVKLLQKDDYQCLFWTATNWARWGELKGIMRNLIDIPKVKAMNERCLELDPEYYCGGPLRFFGCFFSAVPGIFGGDADKSLEYFQKSLLLCPDYLETHLFYAKYYAVKVKNKELFEKELNWILDKALDSSNPYYLENITAKKLAKIYLSEIKKFF